MYSMSELSPRRAAVLAFIRERVEEEGRPPSLAEIAQACGLASRGAARKHVLALAEAGLVEVAAGQARGVRPAGPRARPALLQVPVLGRVAAGAPIGADAGLSEVLALDARLFAQRPDYLLRVQGDSMIDDGILDGDLVGVQRSASARNGQVVIARIDDEITVKLLRMGQGKIRLLPRNPDFAPIELKPGQDFAIEGLYCGLVRPNA